MNGIREFCMKKRRSEKGSITLFTLVAMLFFIIILVLSYMGQINRISSEKKQIQKIEEEYNADGEIEEAYNQALNSMPLNSIIKVGDYVAYTPQTTKTSYTFEEKYSGYSEQTKQQDSLKWRVLNINKNGTIDLISSSLTSSAVYFKGARGYNNGVYLLNDFCNTLYSNPSIGATARSLNIEDIQDKMKIGEDGKRAYETYQSVTTYGNTHSYAINKWYPKQWKNDRGIEGESKSNDLIEYATEEEAKLQETTEDLTVTLTYWPKSALEMKSNFKTADTRDEAKADSIYYELLCNNGASYYYWLASRYVYTPDVSYVYFGLRSIHDGGVAGTYMLNSDSSEGSYGYGIRPVVSLPSSVIDISTEYNEDTGWKMK